MVDRDFDTLLSSTQWFIADTVFLYHVEQLLWTMYCGVVAGGWW